MLYVLIQDPKIAPFKIVNLSASCLLGGIAAEYYRVGPENKDLPHYAWQVFLNGARVMGPGHVIFEPSMEIKYYQRIEESPVINDDLEVKKSVALGAGKLEVDIEYCEFDEDLLDELGNPVESTHC